MRESSSCVLDPQEHAESALAPRHRPDAGLTVPEVARRYRVGEDRVRGWIRRGELRAINTASAACSRPRLVVPPEALPEFERRRSAAAPPKPPRRRRLPEVPREIMEAFP